MVRAKRARRLAVVSLVGALILSAACACLEPATMPDLPPGTAPPATATPTRSPNQRDAIQASHPASAIWHTLC